MKWAFLGDLQIPFHDKRAVDLFFKAMKWWGPDAMDFNGDIDDQLEYSKFSDGTTDEFFNQLKKEKQVEGESDDAFRKRLSPLPFVKKNADGARELYTFARAQHENCNMHASLGNHDIRVMGYMDKKCPEYVDQITPNMLWGLDDLGLTWRPYELPPFERFGGIHVHHGNTTTTTGLAVKSDIENYGISLARGHDHRGGVVYKSYPMTKTTLVGLGTGHLCDPNAYGLKYTTNPSWELGFGIGHVVDDVATLQFIPISPDYVCVVDGRIFRG